MKGSPFSPHPPVSIKTPFCLFVMYSAPMCHVHARLFSIVVAERFMHGCGNLQKTLHASKFLLILLKHGTGKKTKDVYILNCLGNKGKKLIN